VDEHLVADGRLRVLTSPEGLRIEKRSREAGASTRDPAALLDLLLSALDS
jgi:hypothetical protein